jgi:hypothetical protein
MLQARSIKIPFLALLLIALLLSATNVASAGSIAYQVPNPPRRETAPLAAGL